MNPLNRRIADDQVGAVVGVEVVVDIETGDQRTV